MLTRREVIVGGVASAITITTRNSRSTAAQPKTAISFDVPPNACDCHTHLFLNPQKFPFTPDRIYTPEQASVDEMRALHKALHIDRVVIVQPSVYGTDNSATLDGIKELPRRARGVAVVDDKISESALDELGRIGIRGIRLNLETGGETNPAIARQRLESAVRRTQHRNWHIQIFTRLTVIAGIKDLVLESPVPIVFDHFGGARAEAGMQQPGFDTLVELIGSGRAYVKISGAYRCSNQAPDYADVAPLAKALIAANPDRILWGTDWPHPDSARVPNRKPTDIAPLYQIDDGRLLNQLAVWAPDQATRQKILVDNPTQLYGF